jgi:hypothetical protein
MTPSEVRRRVSVVRDMYHEGGPPLIVRYGLLIDLLQSIAEGRCTHPQTCAREALTLEPKAVDNAR